jgi:hypothetical protein
MICRKDVNCGQYPHFATEKNSGTPQGVPLLASFIEITLE